jgi:pimeloyl-ACP methyl ester carboxylesterase
VREQAASIDVPVFVAAGERDVLPGLRAEAAAYPGSPDITLTQVPRCAHMLNFSPQRFRLWRRLHAWGESVPMITNSRTPSTSNQGETSCPSR